MLKVVAVLALAATTFAQLSSYFPYARPFAPTQFRGVSQFPTTPRPVIITPSSVPYSSYVAQSPQIPIIRLDQESREDGTYQYNYETADGITAQEQGGLVNSPSGSGTAARGSYSYTSPEGKVISVSWVADENGFRAVSDAIPTPPPVPPAIQRALEYIAAHPQQEENYERRRYY